MEQRSRRERHEDTRAAILGATRTLILEKGVAGLSLREVQPSMIAGLKAILSTHDDVAVAATAHSGEEALATLATLSAASPDQQRRRRRACRTSYWRKELLYQSAALPR